MNKGIIFWLTIISLVLTTHILRGQISIQSDSTHTLRMQMPTTDFIIRINKSKILEGVNVVKLPVGVYQLEIWTPYHNFIDTTIIIEPSQKYVNLILNFETNLDFIRYNKDVAAYEEQKLAKIALPSVIVAASAGSALYFYYAARNSKERASEAYTRWLGGNLQEKDNLLRNYNRYLSDFNQQRLYNYLSWTAAGVSAYYLYKGIIWYRKNNGPEFKRGVPPFSQFSMDYHNFGGQGVTTFGLTFQLDRK